jgi:hypothetical protein
MFTKALSYESASRSHTPNPLYHQGTLLLERSIRTGGVVDLQQTISTAKRELRVSSADHDMYCELMHLVTGLLYSIFHRSGKQEGLQESVILLEGILEAVQTGSERCATASYILSLCLMVEYGASRLLDDTQKARFHSRNAVEAATALYPYHTDAIIR